LNEIEISNLSFTYENRNDRALDNVNLQIRNKDFLLLAGASGSGKSTLIKCINGLIPHRYVGEYSGEVKIRGQPVPDARFLQLSLTVGTVLQEADKQLVSSIVEDDVAFGPGNLALPRVEIDRRVKQGLAAMDILGLRERSFLEFPAAKDRGSLFLMCSRWNLTFCSSTSPLPTSIQMESA